MFVYTHGGVALAELKRDTTLRLTLPRASHAAFHVIWLSHSTRGDPSFPGWHWDQGCFHPWPNNLPRPIQLGNRNFTALLGFIVPNVQMNYFIEIKHQYFGQDKLAHWLQWISDDWCRCWEFPCLVKPHSDHFIWMNADWKEGLGSILNAGTVKLSCVRSCVDQLPTGCLWFPKSVTFQENVLL